MCVRKTFLCSEETIENSPANDCRLFGHTRFTQSEKKIRIRHSANPFPTASVIPNEEAEKFGADDGMGNQNK